MVYSTEKFHSLLTCRKLIVLRSVTSLRQSPGKQIGYLSCFSCLSCLSSLSVETTSLFFAAKRKGDDTEQAVEKEG